MNKAGEKIKEELLALLPPTIFFFIALHIVGLVRVLMTKGTGLPVTSSAQIALAALIIGKAVLLADLQRGQRDPRRRSDRQPRALRHEDSDQTDDVQSDEETV
jgi:hypothetical protein